MSRENLNPRSNQFLETKRRQVDFYSSVHEVMVIDVQIDRGLVTVRFNQGGHDREVPIPLTGFSRPPAESDKDKNYKRAAWGVYIPQKGDVLNLAFDVRGGPIILGYKAFGWQFMDQWDADNDDKGGINWGVTSKVFKSGDWAWRSSRGSQLYLGDRVTFSSGINSITLNSVTRDAIFRSDLWIGYYGSSSEVRRGSARRLMPASVDGVETPIVDPLTATPAQEYSNYVRMLAMPVTDPKGRLLVRTSYGQVVNDITLQVTPPSSFDPSLTLLTGQGVRVLREVKDPVAGRTNVWAEYVDNMGNYGSSAITATGFQWNTPMAEWQVMNLSTKWISMGTYDIVSGGISTITAASVKIGSAAAVSPLVKGDMLTQALAAYCIAGVVAYNSLAAVVGPLNSIAPGFSEGLAALGDATAALQAAIPNLVSIKNFTD